MSEGKLEDAKTSVMVDTSQIHDKWQKCKSSKSMKKGIKKGQKLPDF